MLYKWSHTVCNLLSLAFLPIGHKYPEICRGGCMYDSPFTQHPSVVWRHSLDHHPRRELGSFQFGAITNEAATDVSAQISV